MRPTCYAVPIALVLSAACGAEPPPNPSTTPTEAPPPTVAPTVDPNAVPNGAGVNADRTTPTAAQQAVEAKLAARLAPFIDAYSNTEPVLSPDGKHVLFRSNREGTWNLYVGDLAKRADPPLRITQGTERAASGTWAADGKYVVFQRDNGADENFHMWRVAADGTGETDLTPNGTLHRDGATVPLRKQDTIVYSARATSDPKTFVFVQSVANGEAKSVFADPGPAFVVDTSADGTHAALLRVVSLSEQVVFEVDLGTGTAVRVFPAEGKKANVSWVAYAPAGRRMLVATDDGAEASYLLALDADKSGATWTEKARYKEEHPATAEIKGVMIAPQGDRLAILVDEGNRSELRILDAHKLTVQRNVETPLGSIFNGPFSRDGRRFTLQESTPAHPADVFAVDAATAKVTPLRDDKRPGLDQLPTMQVTIEAAPSTEGASVPINVYRPSQGSKLPTMVSVHGGPASSAHVGWAGFDSFLASIGYAVVEPNIRGSTGFGRAYEMADNRENRGRALDDIATVNRWVKAQPWADPSRVVIYGGSYGGYMTLMALTRQPDLWRAGVDLVGIADLTTFLKATDQSIRAIFVDEFGDVDKDADLLARFSPLRDKDKIVAPLFVYQGANDPRVPKEESEQIVVAMRTRGIPVEYMLVANEGHSMDRRENRIAFMSRVARFLGEQMGVAAP
jgi:dipeptidyl aminopeptidase/acylaminoacyl peptidase